MVSDSQVSAHGLAHAVRFALAPYPRDVTPRCARDSGAFPCVADPSTALRPGVRRIAEVRVKARTAGRELLSCGSP